jgi:hypothetical protein
MKKPKPPAGPIRETQQFLGDGRVSHPRPWIEKELARVCGEFSMLYAQQKEWKMRGDARAKYDITQPPMCRCTIAGDVKPESDISFRHRISLVAKGDDFYFAALYTGHMLDLVGAKYGLTRRPQESPRDGYSEGYEGL